MSEFALNKRITALEERVAELQERLNSPDNSPGLSPGYGPGSLAHAIDMLKSTGDEAGAEFLEGLVAKNDDTHASDQLTGAFIWAASPQGLSYWSAINERLLTWKR